MTSKKFFNRNKLLVNRFVRNFLSKNKIGIVHGTRATNTQLPRFLERKTVDWDIFVKKPKVKARQLERKLDKRFRGDYFKVKKGKGSPGVKVYKIKSTITNENFVDFATTQRQVPTIAIRGIKFATLKDQKRIAQQNVKKPELKFRREKDRNLLKRIKQFEKLRGKRI